MKRFFMIMCFPVDNKQVESLFAGLRLCSLVFTSARKLQPAARDEKFTRQVEPG